MSDESDQSSDSNTDTVKLDVPDFDDDVDGTQELDSGSIEIIEDSEVESVPPSDTTLEQQTDPSEASDSTQLIDRDRLQRAAERDSESVPPGARTTDQMQAVTESTDVYDGQPRDVDETTSAYTIPKELLEEASAEPKSTRKMNAVTDETAEFDGGSDRWVEVDDSGVLRCIAEVDERGRLVLPEQLLEDDVLRVGMKVVIEAQIIRTDD